MDVATSMIEKAIITNPTYAEAYNNVGLYISSLVFFFGYVVSLHLEVIVLVKVVLI